MAWDVVSKGSNTGLLFSEINQLQANFTALAEQSSGAPRINVMSLADVETGVFSLSVESGFLTTGISAQNNRYQKSGTKIDCVFNLTLDGVGSVDAKSILFGGMPFSNGSIIATGSVTIRAAVGLPASGIQFNPHLGVGVETLAIKYTTLTSFAFLTGSEAGTSFRIDGNITYFT